MSILPMTADPALAAPADYRWLTLAELESVPFPAAMNVPLRLALNILRT